MNHTEYQDYIASHKDFVGFNLDATTADRLHIQSVESAQPCSFCSCKQMSNINPYDPTVLSVINPVYCAFNRVKIDRVIYNRNRNPQVGAELAFFNKCIKELQKMGETDAEYTRYNSKCDRCGVPFGFVHHVGCKNEECPKCHRSMYRSSEIERQLFNCVHHVGRIDEDCHECINVIGRDVGDVYACALNENI